MLIQYPRGTLRQDIHLKALFWKTWFNNHMANISELAWKQLVKIIYTTHGSKNTHLPDSTEYFQIVLYCCDSCNYSYHYFRNLEVNATVVSIFQMWKMRLSVDIPRPSPEANESRWVAIQIKLCLKTKSTILLQRSPSFCEDKTLVQCQVQIFLLKYKPGLSTLWVLKNLDNSPILLTPRRWGKPLGRFVFEFEIRSKRMGSELSRQWKIIPRSTHSQLVRRTPALHQPPGSSLLRGPSILHATAQKQFIFSLEMVMLGERGRVTHGRATTIGNRSFFQPGFAAIF